MNAVEGWIWRVSPVPELLLLLAVAAGIAVGLRALMLRKGSFTPRSASVVAAIAASLILPLLIIGWSVGLLAPAAGPLHFDRGGWSSQQWVRYRMAQDLLDGRKLDGLTQVQVEALLGEADGSAAGDDAWMLRRPRDAFVPFPPELVVDYDSAGRVETYRIEPALSDLPFDRDAV